MKLYIIKPKEPDLKEDSLYILVDEDKFQDFECKLQKLNEYIYNDFQEWHWGDNRNNPEPEMSDYTLEIQDYDSLSLEDKILALMYCINSLY